MLFEELADLSTGLPDGQHCLEFCQRCEARVFWLLGALGEVAERAEAAKIPAPGSALGERVSGSVTPRPPVNLAAVDTVRQLQALVSSWHGLLAESLEVEPPIVSSGMPAGFWFSRQKAWLRNLSGRFTWVANGMRKYSEVLELALTVAERQFPAEPRTVRQHPRPCPLCSNETVTCAWPAGRLPVVSCLRCGWQHDVDWGEIVQTA